MDFHAFARRDLQTLCKKNRIPANMTNIAMADALQELQTVEGMDEILEAMQFLSPKKADARSPDLPRTSRRTSVRRGTIQDEAKDNLLSTQTRARRVTSKAMKIKKQVVEEGAKEEGSEEMIHTSEAGTGSPLPRSRRVTARPSEIRGMNLDGDEGEKQDGQVKMLETPGIPPSGRKTRAAEATGTTRTRTSKKVENEVQEGASETPATLNGRRASARRASKTQVVEEAEKNETCSRTTRRTTRQSTRKQREEKIHSSEEVSKITTSRTAALKMAALAQEEEIQEEEDAAGSVVSDEVSGDKEPKDQNPLHSVEEEVRKAAEIPPDSVAKTAGMELNQEIRYASPDGDDADRKFKEQQKDDEEGEEQKGAMFESEGGEPLTGSEDSPIRGLVISKPTDDVKVTVLIDELKISEAKPDGNHETVDGGNSELPYSPLSSEIPVQIDVPGDHSPALAIGDGLEPQLELEIGITKPDGNHETVDGGRSELPNSPLSSEIPVQIDIPGDQSPALAIGDGLEPQLELEIAGIQLYPDTPAAADPICTSTEILHVVSEQGDANLSSLLLGDERQVESKDSSDDDLQLEHALPEIKATPLAIPSPDPSHQISDGFGTSDNSPKLNLASAINRSPPVEPDEIHRSTFSPLLVQQLSSLDSTALIDLKGQDLLPEANSSSPLPENPMDSDLGEEFEGLKRGSEEKRAGEEEGLAGIYREEEESIEEASGEAKVENKAEKKDLNELSLRKLKTLVRAKLTSVSNNNTKTQVAVGEKRRALATLDENLL